MLFMCTTSISSKNVETASEDAWNAATTRQQVAKIDRMLKYEKRATSISTQ